MEEVRMQSPWVSYTNKIREMFKRDPEIRMTWSDETLILKMYIANDAKAEAISKLLPMTKTFGKVVVNIEIIPANNDFVDTTNEAPEIVTAQTYETAFTGNPIFHYIKVFKDAFLGHPVCYVVFAKEVIQWFNDDLNDLYGNANMLAEDIARSIFDKTKDVDGSIYYCTDIK